MPCALPRCRCHPHVHPAARTGRWALPHRLASAGRRPPVPPGLCPAELVQPDYGREEVQADGQTAPADTPVPRPASPPESSDPLPDDAAKEHSAHQYGTGADRSAHTDARRHRPPPVPGVLPPPAAQHPAKLPAPARGDPPKAPPYAECRAAQLPHAEPQHIGPDAPDYQSSAEQPEDTDRHPLPSDDGKESRPAMAPGGKCPARWKPRQAPCPRSCRSPPASTQSEAASPE